MAELTRQILIQIRDELRKTNGRLDQTNERLDQTNERLGQLEHRQIQTEVRLATEIVAVVGAVNELRDVLLIDRRINDKLENHERRISALEQPSAR